MKILKSKSNEIKNIYIFVSDSLRWDFLSKEVSNMGITFKMIASSTFTAPSFSSIVTGLYPFRHMVFSHLHRIPPDLFTIFDITDVNCRLITENTWTGYERQELNPFYRMLRQTETSNIRDIRTPFICIEDEKGGHCPYDWKPDDPWGEFDCKSFFREYGKKDIRALREKYRKGIDRSVKIFKQRLSILEDRGILEDTLVLFTSDHGENLGEYGGIINHGSIVTPEMIYVPMVLINPNIQRGKDYSNVGVIRHVDILPTIIDILNKKVKRHFDGKSILSMNELPKIGYANLVREGKSKILNKEISLRLTEKSLWDKNGGWVFREDWKGIIRLLRIANALLDNDNLQSLYIKGNFKNNKISTSINVLKIINSYHKKVIRYGNPNFDKKTARNNINIIENSKIKTFHEERIKSAIYNLKIKGRI